jgi:molybdate transport system substrate-binding protein
MKIRSSLAAATIGFALSLLQVLAAEAAEVKVMAGVAMRAVWEELGPQFERATGHKLAIWYGFSGTIRERMEAGEAFDVAVFGKDSLDEHTKQGKIAADTHTAIARVGMGMAARAGAPKPDIGSVEAFKRALLDAKSVTYQPKGATGIHVTSVFKGLGITEQMKAKYRRLDGKQQSTLSRVASGEAEFGFSFTNEILVARGVELVGPLPLELQRYSMFTAGVATAAREPAAAKALIAFLRSPPAVAAIKAKGMEPATP